MKKLRGEKMRTGIYRIWMLDELTGKKHEPEKKFEAVRYVMDGGIKKRQWRCFKGLPDAKAFVESGLTDITVPHSPTFREIADKFTEHDKNRIELSSWVNRQSHRKHLRFFDDLDMRQITPDVIDAWLSHVKSEAYLKGQQSTRQSYKNEFTLLHLIFRYYQSRFDYTFAMPLLRDHRMNLQVRPKALKAAKDMTLEQFERFIAALDEMVAGTKDECVAVIARAQYALYARVSEVAALSFEDVGAGVVTLRSSVQWHRQKGVAPLFRQGHKASDGKVVPSTYACSLLSAWAARSGVSEGRLFLYGVEPIPYRTLQSRYDRAHKKAGTGMTGTHVLRHASLSELYALSGDIQQTREMAGHADLASTQRYAKVRRTDLHDTQALMDEKLISKMSG